MQDGRERVAHQGMALMRERTSKMHRRCQLVEPGKIARQAWCGPIKDGNASLRESRGMRNKDVRRGVVEEEYETEEEEGEEEEDEEEEVEGELMCFNAAPGCNAVRGMTHLQLKKLLRSQPKMGGTVREQYKAYKELWQTHVDVEGVPELLPRKTTHLVHLAMQFICPSCDRICVRPADEVVCCMQCTRPVHTRARCRINMGGGRFKCCKCARQ